MNPIRQVVPESQQQPNTQIFAWAGLRFRIPAAWETGYLAHDHGWLEADFKPTLEFKTAHIKGRFSFRRHLKRLEQAAPLRLQITELPAAWQPHLTTFQTRSFKWQGPNQAGEGLLIYCPDCQRATLMQFFQNTQTPAAIATVLRSFADHGRARHPTVAVYDIQLTVPDRLPLERFRFESGRFELVFGGHGKRLTFWRWSPADAALRHHGGTLLNFARRHALPPQSALPGSPQTLPHGFAWRWPTRRSWRNRLPSKLRRRLPPACLRIWHLQAANRILAVRGDGNWDDRNFTEICGRYEILS